MIEMITQSAALALRFVNVAARRWRQHRCASGLTQLVLGADRDAVIVAFDFDQRDEDVKALCAR